MLVHIKLIIYLLLLRLKSLLHSFWFELGSLISTLSGSGRCHWLDLPCGLAAIRVSFVSATEVWEVGDWMGMGVKMWAGVLPWTCSFPDLSPSSLAPLWEPTVSTGEQSLHCDTWYVGRAGRILSTYHLISCTHIDLSDWKWNSIMSSSCRVEAKYIQNCLYQYCFPIFGHLHACIVLSPFIFNKFFRCIFGSWILIQVNTMG